MTRSEINDTSAYLTETLQLIRSIGVDAERYLRIREAVESDKRFAKASKPVREEIEAALEARRFNIAKLSTAI